MADEEQFLACPRAPASGSGPRRRRAQRAIMDGTTAEDRVDDSLTAGPKLWQRTAGRSPIPVEERFQPEPETAGMKSLMGAVFSLALLSLLVAPATAREVVGQRTEIAARLGLVPAPRVVQWDRSWVRLPATPKVVVVESTEEEVGVPGLAEDLAVIGSNASTRDAPRGSHPIVVIRPSLQAFAPTPWQRDEAYSLTVGRDSILLTGESVRARFYAVQTLRQLIRGAEEGRIPALTVRDYPAVRWRGVLDDISRGQAPARTEFSALFSRLSYYKLNVYFLYIEDMARFWSAPSVGVGRGALTPAELRMLAKAAGANHVTVVPIFQSVGHQGRLLQSDELRAFSECRQLSAFEIAVHSWMWRFVPAIAAWLGLADPDVSQRPVSCFALAEPTTAPRVAQLIDEIAGNVPSPYFHLGADEPVDLGRGASSKEVRTRGLGVVYATYLNELIEHVSTSLHRVPIVFGDVLLANPDAMRSLDKRTAVMDWQYAPAATDSTIVSLRKAGFEEVFACAGLWNWFSVYPNYARAVPNISSLARAAIDAGAAGFVAASWGDGGARSLRSANWPGYAYAAEAAWFGPAPFDEFLPRFGVVEYGSASPEIARAIGLVGLREFPTLGYSQRVLERPVDVRIRSASWRTQMQALDRDMRDARLAVGRGVAGARFNARDLMVVDNAASQLQHAAQRELVLDSLARRLAIAPWGSMSTEERVAWEARVSALRDSLAWARDRYASLWRGGNRELLLRPVLERMDEQCRAYETLLPRDALPERGRQR